VVVVRVPVSLFARYREAVGRDRIEVDVPDGATVEDVWRAVAAAHPVLVRYRPHTLFAVGNDYVRADRQVQPGEELACFPPVSGGSRPVPRHR
jgi:molybdopterin converting factor small subunit